MIAINYKPDARQLRSFTRVWFPVFVAAGGALLWWRSGTPTAGYTLWGVGALVEAAMLVSSPVARFAFVALTWVTYPIGLAVSYLALGTMFFLVFTPLGWLMRIAGRDPLGFHARRRPSHWLRYQQDDRPERAFRQF